MSSTSFGNNSGFQVAHNNGRIYQEIHLSPERPETSPRPLSTVPFPRSRDFVRRPMQLDWIHQKISEPGCRIAVVGCGGVGKSQLAIECSYQIRDELPQTWVFWIHASNETCCKESFRSLATRINIPGCQDTKANIFELVENWLLDEKNGKWICILDNTDDDKLFTSLLGAERPVSTYATTNAPTKPLLQYIPQIEHGSTIITSRSKEVAMKIVNYKDILEVGPMEHTEAVELFERQLGLPQTDPKVHQLVEALEFMPLAIVQAASYIRERKSRCSVSQYLESFQKSDQIAIKLLETEAGYLHRHWEATTSILVAWHISFDHIQQTRKSAAELLALMSFCDRQGIPECLLKDRPCQPKHRLTSELTGDSSSEDSCDSGIGSDFDDDIMTLENYSFISTCENGSTFMMHRLIQLAMRAWLKSHGQIGLWRDRFISNLCQEFPNPEYENWSKCKLLYPHVRPAMVLQPESKEIILRWGQVIQRGAWYALEIGSLTDMRDMVSKFSEQRMVPKDLRVLFSTWILPTACIYEGDLATAAQLQLQTIEVYKKVLGEDHPGTLSAMDVLALTFYSENQMDMAEKLQLQVVEGRKRQIGEQHRDTLSSIAALAAIYSSQGRPEEAKELEMQVAEALEKLLGKNNSNRVLNITLLAEIRGRQGQWEQAERLQMEAVETLKQELGMEHPQTLSRVNKLAQIYNSRGQWKEAERLEMQAVEGRRKILGENHPDTLWSMTTLALTLFEQNRIEEVEQLLTQILDLKQTKYGADHPETLNTMLFMMEILAKQNRWEEAEQLAIQIMETTAAKFGVDHPDTLKSVITLAPYCEQNRGKEVSHLMIKIFKANVAKDGAENADTLRAFSSLVIVFFEKGEWEIVEMLLTHIWEKFKANIWSDYPRTLGCMGLLAAIWKASGRHTEALDLLRDCLAKSRQILGPDCDYLLRGSRVLLEWETEEIWVND